MGEWREDNLNMVLKVRFDSLLIWAALPVTTRLTASASKIKLPKNLQPSHTTGNQREKEEEKEKILHLLYLFSYIFTKILGMNAAPIGLLVLNNLFRNLHLSTESIQNFRINLSVTL